MILYDLKDKPEYIKEFVLICHEEWGNPWNSNNVEKILKEKIQNTLNRLENFPTLILLEDKNLVGFVSLFEKDCEDRIDLSPWYATLYIKSKYRGKGISKILTDEIIRETKKRKYEKLYLKTDLNNFYEKYNFKYLEATSNGEKIYYIDLI